jgi:plasmid stability protein
MAIDPWMLLNQQQRCYHDGMPVSITIRNVPDEVRDELAARAARSGRSLQEFLLRQLADLAVKPSVEEFVSRARGRARASGIELSAQQILADRDADRA